MRTHKIELQQDVIWRHLSKWEMLSVSIRSFIQHPQGRERVKPYDVTQVNGKCLLNKVIHTNGVIQVNEKCSLNKFIHRGGGGGVKPYNSFPLSSTCSREQTAPFHSFTLGLQYKVVSYGYQHELSQNNRTHDQPCTQIKNWSMQHWQENNIQESVC